MRKWDSILQKEKKECFIWMVVNGHGLFLFLPLIDLNNVDISPLTNTFSFYIFTIRPFRQKPLGSTFLHKPKMSSFITRAYLAPLYCLPKNIPKFFSWMEAICRRQQCASRRCLLVWTHGYGEQQNRFFQSSHL